MKTFQLILIFFLVSAISTMANSELSEETWKTSTKNIDYTETYKEFKQKETKKDKTPSNLPERKFRNPVILKTFILVIIGGALLVLIIFLVINITKIKVTHKVNIQSIVDDIDDPDQYKISDLEKYLHEALTNDDYRLAIRIHFLMLIKSLKENEIIIWRKEKTNRDYYNEVCSKNYHGVFRQLVITFEKVWYAGYSIKKQTYEQLSVKFNHIQAQIEGE